MALNWSNLITRHPVTGATRVLTPDLLAEASLAPKTDDPDWHTALSLARSPWQDSYKVAARPVRATLERAFRDMVCATGDARIAGIDSSQLPDGRARRHLHGLLEMGAALGDLPADLAAVRHVIQNGTHLETLAMCPAPFGCFDTTLEATLHARLLADHGATEGPPWEVEAGQGALGQVQAHLLKKMLHQCRVMTACGSLACGMRWKRRIWPLV
ncbi:hypothetical protein [Profundibacter sp.]